jgi:cobalt/nickel transport system permease protein
MSFHHLDRFAHVRSIVTAMPPSGRVVATLLLALTAATLPPGAWPELAALGALSLLLVIAARIPAGAALGRLAWPLGFVLLASLGLLLMVPGEPILRAGPIAVTDAGADRFAVVMARAVVALAPTVVLVSTTSFPELLHALRQLRLPAAVATALGLGYRLLYITVDELERLQRAARSRNAGHGTAGRRRLLAALAATTLARSFARGERTYRAMLARGFAGDLPPLEETRWTARSAFALATIGALAAAVIVSAHVVS